jgi:hypothetical protein
MRRLASLSLTVILTAGLFSGCEKKAAPPALPPVETMTIDFSEFSTVKKSGSAVENINWTTAATVAGIWNLVIAANIALPVAAFNLAINNTPAYQDNKTWEWNYSVNAVGAVYKARLTGQIGSDSIRWKMYISKDGVGAFPEFMWFKGSSALDGKKGQWILNHSKDFPEPFLQIDWTLDGSDIGTIKYIYIREKKNDRSTDTFKSSFIEYGLTKNALNAYYNVNLNISGTPNDFKTVNIEWSTTLHNGHIKSLHYFGDTNWHCWDGNGNDVTCN